MRNRNLPVVCEAIAVSVIAAIPTALLLVHRWIRFSFGKVSAWQILYHAGEDASMLAGPQVVALWIASALFLLLLAGIACAAFAVERRMRPRLRLTLWSVSLVAYFLLVARYLDHDLKLTTFVKSHFESTTLFSDNFRPVAPADVRFPNGKTNIVVIMVESLEDTFTRPAFRGTNLLPQLSALRSEGLSFRGQRQVSGTECTVMAQTSLIYGMPRLGNRDFNTVTKLAIRAPSVFRVLLDAGYAGSYAQGGNIGFASTASLFGQTPEMNVISMEDFERSCDKFALAHEYAAQDELLIPVCKREISRLAGTGRPFFFMCMTINTHAPRGWLPASAPHPRKDPLENALLNCDTLLAEFITWLRHQPFADTTAILVVGDHLFMSDFDDAVPRSSRSTFNTIIRPGQSPEIRSRDFATFDWAPTILELTGADLPDGRFGLGVSLLHSGARTLMERLGSAYYENEIHKPDLRYRQLVYEEFLWSR